VEQIELSREKSTKKTDQLSRQELIQRYDIMRDEVDRLARELYELRQINISDEQLKLITEEQLAALTQTIYGTSSERWKKPVKPKKEEPPKPRVKKPSTRYPNIPVRELFLESDIVPDCDQCGKKMLKSGMTEDSEQLTVIPKKYEVLRFKRAIYRCSCQSCMLTTPMPPRIVEGSGYSDEMILDVVLSKYCDLIPVQRYVGMASRAGLKDLPPHSLIDLTHKFAFFVKEVYRLIKAGVLKARVLHADETPHKMLEGSDTKHWYLWGFSTPLYCFLECRDTRSGDVASEILLNSLCEVLVSDVFSGYGRALRIVNQQRKSLGKVEIENANCNAHSRRYFFKAVAKYPESGLYLDHYHEIYQLEDLVKGKPPDEVLKIRQQMGPRFETMKSKALEELPRYPKDIKHAKALSYFIENFRGLTRFLGDPEVPIDNNPQERLLRSHVVGRKTWYGTHSEQGAETAAILFSIVETCKLNGVNPREYFAELVKDMLAGAKPYTPVDFKALPRS
jgi:transposase